jgi:hypothetical protein
MGSPKEVTQTSKSEPWAEAKPFFEDLYKKAQEAMGQTNKSTYGGDLWAAPNETQITANQNLKDASGEWSKVAGGWDYGSDNLRSYGDTLIKNASDTSWLNPDTNPWVKASTEAALGDVTREYTRNVLPQMGDAAIKGGAYGGSRQGIMEGLAAGEYSREANDAATRIYADNYQKERDRMGAAQQLAATHAPGMYSGANSLEQQKIAGQQYGIDALAKAGAQEQGWDQSQNTENYDRYKMDQASVWAGIPEMLSVLTGGSFQSSTQTGPNPNYTNPMQTGMGVMSMLTGLADAFKPEGGYNLFK